MPRVPKVPPASPRGKKSVPAGYKNYGQFRSEQVKARNQARRTTTTSPSYSRPAGKPRFKAKELTDSGTRDRTISRFNRLKAMGVKVRGVSQASLDTGAGARRVKRALRKAREGRTKYSI